MAIQFPASAVDGEEYTYLITQQVFTCFKSSPTAIAKWAAKGTISPTSFGYRGGLNITSSAPISEKGNIWSVLDGGVAHSSFIGLAGTQVDQWTLIIQEGPNWYTINTESGDVVQGPWVRTEGGIIKPAVSTDDLDMDQGNFLINELDELL